MQDLLAALKHARSSDCRMYLALRLVAVRESNGCYAQLIQGPLTADMRTLLALAVVKELTMHNPGAK